jgi:putative FmdB family regulatory protein
MPTYSYRCTQCSTAFDVQQAFTDDSLTECPSCQGRLRKIFAAVGVTFTGSGFYRTDSRAGDAKKSGASGESKDSGESKGSGDSQNSGDSTGSGGSAPASTPSTPSPTKTSTAAPAAS